MPPADVLCWSTQASGWGVIKTVVGDTLPKTSMDPEKWWLESYFHLGENIFRGKLSNFRWVCSKIPNLG